MDDDQGATGIIGNGIVIFAALFALTGTSMYLKRPCRNDDTTLRCVKVVYEAEEDQAIRFDVGENGATPREILVYQRGVKRPCPWFSEAFQELKRAKQIELENLEPLPRGGYRGMIKHDKNSFEITLLKHGCDRKIEGVRPLKQDKESHAPTPRPE